MTPREDISNLIALCEAWRDGKMIQFYDENSEIWVDWNPTGFPLVVGDVCTLNNDEKFRVKPSPKMIPLGPRNISVGMVFSYDRWDADSKAAWCFANKEGVQLSWYDKEEPISYEELQASWKYSKDNGKTWHRCEWCKKEEA